MAVICGLVLFLFDFGEDFASSLLWDCLSEAGWRAVLKWGRADAVFVYKVFWVFSCFSDLACPEFCFLFEVSGIIVMLDCLG